ncbi:MAG: hypothetical protein OIF48_09145 [Silicimonas sp.]|nr:hypothetical protein [Silicimonas sp.]
MTSEFLSLVVLHFACADLSETRPLNGGEVLYCSTVYQEVKLSFMPDLDLAAYRALPLADQGAVNSEAYLRFVAWRAAHPELVAHLERVARGEEGLSEAT